MALIACPVLGKQKSVDICNAFIKGAPASAEGYVFYGVNETNKKAWVTAKATGLPWYYIDNSYFDCMRGVQFRVTRDAVQLDPRGRESDGRRFVDMEIKLSPKRTSAGKWLAVEQSPSFMRDVVGDVAWLEKAAKLIPGAGRMQVRRWSPDKIKLQTTLPVDMVGASHVLTHSSAAAVTAVIAGINVWVSEMSCLFNMQWEDRERTLRVLADNQFSLDEMKKGVAWSWLNRK